MYTHSLNSESVSRASVVPKCRHAEGNRFFQPKIQRKCSECEKEEKEQVQRKETNTSGSTTAPSIVSSVLSSGNGQSMDASTRQFMESRFGEDFGKIRIHTDERASESASAIQAKAYTSGRDIVFGAGQYQPSSESGRRLLAHELTHVGQQEHNSGPAASIQRSNGNSHLQSPILSGNNTLESVLHGGQLIFRGGQGDHVQRIQSGLMQVGLLLPHYGADSVFGQETAIALRYFQQSQGLGSDAIVGRQTIARLDSMLVNRVTIPPNPVIPEPAQTNNQAPANPASGTQNSGRKVSTLCHRNFTFSLMPGSLARHCYVWGHDSAVPAAVGQIRQEETLTYDNSVSGEPDPMPVNNTRCSNTYPVDPVAVKGYYKSMCHPADYNLVSFNCCTCAYLALSAAGANVRSGDFPSANQGIGLPESHGSGARRGTAETVWFNNIDEIEDILDNNITIEQLKSVPLEMKLTWVNNMLGGIYTTENEGRIIIKIFKGTNPSDRRRLYQMIEGHPWEGDWHEGLTVVDDRLVDNLYRSQLNELRDIINGG